MKVAMIGCGGHSRSVADVYLSTEKDAELEFFDTNAKPGECIFDSYSVVPLSEFDPSMYYAILLGIGDNITRRAIYEKYVSFVDKFNIVISDTAHVGKNTEIHKGVYIATNAFIGPEAEIGEGSIINTGAIVEHQVKVGKFSHISVNATICGKTTVGDNVFVGAGSTVIDGLSICDNVVIGAGSVVIESISCGGTYVGTPAKLIRKQK